MLYNPFLKVRDTNPASSARSGLQFYPLQRRNPPNAMSKNRWPMDGRASQPSREHPTRGDLLTHHQQRAMESYQATRRQNISPHKPAAPTAPAASANPTDRLRAMNQNLPDGVHYEPLDEHTIKLMQKYGKTPGSTASANPAATQKPTAPITEPDFALVPDTPPNPLSLPTLSDDDMRQIETITSLMQDERNAALFYRHLSTQAERSDYRAVLKDMAEQSAGRLATYTSLLKSKYNQAFEPQESQINDRIPFDEGVDLALMEENKSLHTLAALLDHMDETHARAIHKIMFKKVANHNLLHLIDKKTKLRLDTK